MAKVRPPSRLTRIATINTRWKFHALMETGEGRSVAATLIDAAMRVTHRLFAHRAPFECKDVLKGAGYRWSPDRKAWWIEADQERILNERAWLQQLAGAVRPEIEEITWLDRHRCKRARSIGLSRRGDCVAADAGDLGWWIHGFC